MRNILSVAVALAVLLGGCVSNAPPAADHAMILFGKDHALTLAEKGIAGATIVVDASASESERHAAEELKRFLGEVTGASFTIGASDGKNRILVGPGAARLADPKFDTKGLGADGIVIRTFGNDLILAGGAPRGTLYAVYTFLEDHVGCRWWSSKASTIPNKPTLTVGALDVRYVPPLEMRETFWFDAFDGDWSARNKSNGKHCRLEKKHGGKIVYDGLAHTFNQLIPPEKYYGEHPEWFSEINGRRIAQSQLCLTNEAMRTELIKNLKERIRRTPEAVSFSVSQNDWFRNCQCANCAALDKKEGSASGSLLHFVNAVAAEIEPEFPRITINTLAYQYTRKPPKFVKPRGNVIVVLCSIECSFSRPLTDERNNDFRDDLIGWSKISGQLYIWDYTTDFAHYLLPHPNLRVLAPNIRFFVAHNAKGIFEQGAYETVGADMAELRAWVLAKLLWKPALDPQALIEEFARGYYGPAAGEVLAYIKLLHDRVEVTGDWLGCFSPETNRFLTFEIVNAAWSHLTAAEAAVKENPDLRRRVQVAQLPLLYTFMRRWDAFQIKAKWIGADWPIEDNIEKVFERFMAVARDYGIDRLSEGNSKFDALEKVVKAVKERGMTAQEVFDRSIDLLQEKKYGEAIAGFQKIVQTLPNDPLAVTSAYNIACGYALMGDKPQALTWLKTAMERGFKDIDHIRADEDLKILRDDPAFKELIKE